MTPAELTNALQNFTGTENYHRFSAIMPNVLLTDGAKFLAEEAGARSETLSTLEEADGESYLDTRRENLEKIEGAMK